MLLTISHTTAANAAISRSLSRLPWEVIEVCSRTKDAHHRVQELRRHLSASVRSDTGKAPYRVLFAGSDRFSCASLEALAGARDDLLTELHVLCSPDRRTSRGLKQIKRPLVRTRAEELGLPVHVLPHEGIKAWNLPQPFLDPGNPHNLLVTASFGHLIPNAILDHFAPLNTLNVHPSLLPKYRGAAPIQWCIANGDKETGVSIQTLSRDKFDYGRILAQTKMQVEEEITYSDLEERLASKGAALLLSTLKNLAAAQNASCPSGESHALKAPKITSDHARIDFNSASALECLRKHRGFGHQFHLWTMLGEKRVQLLEVQRDDQPDRPRPDGPPGTAALSRCGQFVVLKCHDDSLLLIQTLKTEGRKALHAKQWWIGAAHKDKTVLFV